MKVKKIMKYMLAITIVCLLATSCSVKKKRGPVPCPHFSISILK